MKTAQQIITKRSALFGAIIPRGISRIAVLGLRASKLLSRYRLKAIAALLAATMQIIPIQNELIIGLYPESFLREFISFQICPGKNQSLRRAMQTMCVKILLSLNNF